MFFSRKARSFGCQGVDAVRRTVSAVVVTGFTYGVVAWNGSGGRRRFLDSVGGIHEICVRGGGWVVGLYMLGLHEIAPQVAHLVPI